MPQKAAVHLVNYWEERRTLFGADKFYLPMTLDGAVRDDRTALEAGFIHLLPEFDASGRQLVWSPLSKDKRMGYDRLSAARVSWYVHEVILQNPNSAEKGCVLLIDARDMTFWEFDPDLDAWYLQTMLKALPIQIVSLHVCNFESYIMKVIVPVWLALMDKVLHNRMIVHSKSPVDELSCYGISPEALPSELGGRLGCDISHSEWGQFVPL